MEDNLQQDIEIRKKKIFNFLKKPQVWVVGLLIVALILGIYIRSMPMLNHGGKPGLWDITTNNWTLGPDLDPWLFLRTTKTIIDNGTHAKMDFMRNVPLGFDNTQETLILPHMMAYTYKIIKPFYSGTTPEFAGALFPVIMFALTIISFFLFVREIFVNKTKKSKNKANIISLIATFFMIVTPIFLSRTIAGIPEKESAAFFFMFLTFYLFLKAWKSEKIKIASILAVLAGLSTAIMGLIWGGVLFIYIPIAITSLIAFILNKINKKEFIIYSLWVLPAILIGPLFSSKVTFSGMLTSLSSGLAFLVFIIMVTHFVLWETKLSQTKILNKIKVSKNIVSLIIAVLLGVILSSILFGPSFIVEKLNAIHQMMFKPVIGRWNTTVAENRQPFFTEWGSSFGPFIKNIPLMFWLFIIGSVTLFKKMLNKLKPKDSWILTGGFVILLLGMIFSRYSGASLFNGENFISKLIYYGSVLLFLFFAVKIYLKYYKEGNQSSEKIKYEYLLLLVLFLIAIFSARGAVRLIMVLGPIAPIFLAYLIYESVAKFLQTKDETKKILFGIIVIIILVSSIFIFWTDFNQIKDQAYNFVPSLYNQQWQKAMDWVRTETPPTIIENEEFKGGTVFGHWWDYGYWVQSIGERATIVDGGNAITFWNYYIGRLVLTGDNQHDALEFLYNHNTTHFLIDSSDIGKYGAFSSIGSNENYDRYSWIGTLFQDEKQTYETKNSTIYIYSGGTYLDEDLIIEYQGKEMFFPAQQTIVAGVIVPFEKIDGNAVLTQPQVILIYQGQQYQIGIKYASMNNEFYGFDLGIDACIFIFPKIEQQNNGITQNPFGAAMFLSPRLMRGMLVQKYILNDPFDNFRNFKLVHSEPNMIIDSLNQQGLALPEFVYFQGIQGPIKIWEIEYTGEEKIKEEYLDKDASKYLSWQL